MIMDHRKRSYRQIGGQPWGRDSVSLARGRGGAGPPGSAPPPCPSTRGTPSDGTGAAQSLCPSSFPLLEAPPSSGRPSWYSRSCIAIEIGMVLLLIAVGLVANYVIGGRSR